MNNKYEKGNTRSFIDQKTNAKENNQKCNSFTKQQQYGLKLVND